MADSKQHAASSITIKASTALGPLAVHLAAKPEEFITGDTIHKMAARALIADLESGNSLLHAGYAYDGIVAM
jgi:hypothetical protein